MKCPMCDNELSNYNLIGPWYAHLRDKNGKETGQVQVCGRCYMLTSINDYLKELTSGHNRRS